MKEEIFCLGKIHKLIKLPKHWKIYNGAGGWKAAGICSIWTSSPSPLLVPHTHYSNANGSQQRRIYVHRPWIMSLEMWFYKRQESMQKHLRVNTIKMSQVQWLPPALWTGGCLCCVAHCFSTPPLCPTLCFGCSAPLGKWSGVWLHSGWKEQWHKGQL